MNEPNLTPWTGDEASAMKPRYLWMMLTVFVGMALWAQLLLVPLLAELRYSDGRIMAVAVYLIPILLLGLGVALRRSGVVLMLFPVSLLPALALLPAPDWASLSQGATALWLLATFAAYLVVGASQDFEWRTTEMLEPARRDETAPSATDDYRWFYSSRLAAGLFVLLTLVYGVFFDGENGALFREHHGEGEAVAVVFTALIMFFAWCVLVYMMILVPGANVEYDRRRLNRQLDGWTRQWTRHRQLLLVSGWLGAGFIVAIVAFWFF